MLDRYHIMAKMSKAIDEVRAKEAKELMAKGYEPVLERTRWLLLKRPENLSESQEPKLAALLQYNLRSVRGYLLKDLESDGSVSRDDKHREEKKVQGLTDEFVKKIEEIASQKEEEILQV